jgi:2-iminobutanoate/2-iminopropanoate deaminase
MEKIRRNYPDIAPAGPTYNRAIRSGNWLFISGCTARGTPSQGKSLMEQLCVTLDRIMRIVAAEGGKPGDIVKITTYVTSIADWRTHGDEQQSLFIDWTLANSVNGPD